LYCEPWPGKINRIFWSLVNTALVPGMFEG
jgi:hypothetical protein